MSAGRSEGEGRFDFLIGGDYAWVLYILGGCVGALAVAYAVGFAVWSRANRAVSAGRGTRRRPAEEVGPGTRAAHSSGPTKMRAQAPASSLPLRRAGCRPPGRCYNHGVGV